MISNVIVKTVTMMIKLKILLSRWFYCISTSFRFNAMSIEKRQIANDEYKVLSKLDKNNLIFALPILKLSISEIVLFRCKGLSDDQLYHAPVGDTLHHPLLADHHGLRPVSHLDHLRPHAPFPPHHLVNQRLRPSIRQLFWYQQASTLILFSQEDSLFHLQWY